MNIDARRCGSASGSVTAITIANAAPSADDVNHFWPLITKSSPSRTARVASSVGFDPAVSGSVIEKQLRISPSTSGRSQRACCSGVPWRWRISTLPASGACVPNARWPSGERPSASENRPCSTIDRPSPPHSTGAFGAHSPI